MVYTKNRKKALMIKVMIVEDDSEIRNLYGFSLKQNGFDVIEAADGAIAAKQLDANKPDVILLDMLMPGISGLDFLRNNNVHHRYPATKIIAFSNIETPRVVEEAKSLGITSYFLKVNVTPHQMVDIIKGMMGGKPAAKV